MSEATFRDLEVAADMEEDARLCTDHKIHLLPGSILTLSRYRDELQAPLIEALQAALCDDPDWRRLAVDALAKAEGRTR
jgi:hypothetical protein